MGFPRQKYWEINYTPIKKMKILGFPGGASDKELACQCRRHGFNSWVRKIPWRRKWQPTPVFLPGDSHGQKSLAGYSTRGLKELDTTEQLHFTSRHHQACSQNKGLSRASWLWTSPLPAGDRQARAVRARRGQLQTQRGIIDQLQADFIASQDFLGFWMVDILREGTARDQLPRRNTWHT